jgi:outer membrane protein
MLTSTTKVLAIHHTGWYDRLMRWKHTGVFLRAIIAIAMISPPCHADDLQLRPAYPQPASLTNPQTTSSTNPQTTSPTNPQTTSIPASAKEPIVQSGPASQAASGDFEAHRKSLKRVVRSQPSQAGTGAGLKDAAASGNLTTPGSAAASGFPTTSGSGTPGMSASATSNSSVDSGNEIVINPPRLESLISVNEYLNPFSLDASGSTPISLKSALDIGLDRNLDLAISLAQTKQSKFSYYSALGKFLPDPTLGFSEYFAHGHIGLPFNIFTPQTGATAGAVSTGTTSNIVSNGRDSTVTVNRPFEIMHAGGEFYAYRGGSVMFGALQARNTYRARTQGERATLSDTLLTISQNYYNLVLAETVLQIRIDAVRTSEEQLRRNQARFHSGLATNLEVLQSKTQLSRDKQALVDQQISRRSAAITLANTLNMNLGGDFKPATNVVQKIRLVDPRLSIGQVLQMAIDHRPELKQYEQLRRAAKKAIFVTASNLQPTVLLSGQAYGIGPPSNVNSLGVFSVSANWRLHGFGTVDSLDLVRAKWQAREASLNSQKELQTVCSQVRNSYIQILDKERNISEATNEVVSSAEELRLAELRKASGLGLNLDIITAQRDYTQARVSKAQAIIDYNIAQVQLLHDTGLISIAGLTSGRLLNKSDLN